MSEEKTIWKERAADPKSVAAFISRGENEAFARILVTRGVTVENFDEHLASPQDLLKKYLVSPTSLPGVSKAVDVILPFLIDGEKQIIVYGDYDVDGVCATAILVKTLSALGAKNVKAFFPNRFTEGYGITPNSINRLLSENPNVELLITVDNGITAAAEIAELRKRGITVVVTDHHIPGDSIPDADALVNPKVASDDGKELDDLCGAGVAFFLSSALTKVAVEKNIYTGDKFSAPLFVLAGLATVADLMPLTKQNRLLVKCALHCYKKNPPVGLHSLYLKAARKTVDLSARDFAFMLAPRINAAGRMDSAEKAYELLMAENRDEADKNASELDGFNATRRSVEAEMQKVAREQIEASPDKYRNVIVVSFSDEKGDEGENKKPKKAGVAGIVAARLMDTCQKPTVVIVDGHGSVRAPEGYNVHKALTDCSEVLSRFGGHACAGGLSINAEGSDSFEKFFRLFDAVCVEQRKALSKERFIEYDVKLEPDDLDVQFYNKLLKLEPFGESNPEPIFVMENVNIESVKVIGFERNHLSLEFKKGENKLPRAVWWKVDQNTIKKLNSKNYLAGFFDIMFHLVVSDFNHTVPELELIIHSIRRSNGNDI